MFYPNFANKKFLEKSWQWHLQKLVNSPEKLNRYLENLSTENINFKGVHQTWQERMQKWGEEQERWKNKFQFGVSLYYLSLADWNDPNCPILQQVLPNEEEFTKQNFESWDPLSEETNMPVPSLTHRYPDRVLWYLSHSCAVYCRFCMRKRKVSQASLAPSRKNWNNIFQYIEKNTKIKEVILSGGDPLSLDNQSLKLILLRLRKIKHIYSLRIHTRMPVSLPMRIDDVFCKLLSSIFPITIVTHFNHAKEITETAKKYIKKLKMSGVSLLNQAVLLKGINDNLQTQESLHLSLLQAGIQTYYLHRCDPIVGTSYFRVPLKRGINILRELRGRNPGIAIPRYVIDLPGGGGKVPLEYTYLKDDTLNKKNSPKKQNFTIENWAGEKFSVEEYL